MPHRLLWAILYVLVAGQTFAVASNTLGDVLKGSGIPTSGRTASDLDRRITSYATFDAPDEFVIGYYSDDGAGLLGETLNVDLYRKAQAQWVTRRFGRNAEDGDHRSLFGGSVIGIAKARDCFLLNTHVNPSASLTLVVDMDLNYRDTLFGWAVAIFPDGLVAYQHSEVHFAPTHYVEMSIYDPRSKKHWQIYPKKPYPPVRQQHVEKVRAAYRKRGEEWFKKNNHHMNPELFDNFLQGEVAANGATHSLAFVIAFDNTDTWDYAEKLKLQNFGPLVRGLAEYRVSEAPPEGIFELFGRGLQGLMQANLQNAFLELFETDQVTQELIRKAFAGTAEGQDDWHRRFIALDARWGRPEVWRSIQATLATPPEATEVVCVFRNLDQEQRWEYREMRLSDFQKKLGDRPLSDYLDADVLSKILVH